MKTFLLCVITAVLLGFVLGGLYGPSIVLFGGWGFVLMYFVCFFTVYLVIKRVVYDEQRQKVWIAWLNATIYAAIFFHLHAVSDGVTLIGAQGVAFVAAYLLNDIYDKVVWGRQISLKWGETIGNFIVFSTAMVGAPMLLFVLQSDYSAVFLGIVVGTLLLVLCLIRGAELMQIVVIAGVCALGAFITFGYGMHVFSIEHVLFNLLICMPLAAGVRSRTA